MRQTSTAIVTMLLALSAAACDPSNHAQRQMRREAKQQMLQYSRAHSPAKPPQPFLKFHTPRHNTHRQHKGTI
jgi:hypothetical protein